MAKSSLVSVVGLQRVTVSYISKHIHKLAVVKCVVHYIILYTRSNNLFCLIWPNNSTVPSDCRYSARPSLFGAGILYGGVTQRHHRVRRWRFPKILKAFRNSPANLSSLSRNLRMHDV